MAGLPIQLVLLRNVLPDLPVRPGDVLPARVVAREGAQGTLFLAGVRVPAQLPPELAAGTRLRLRVQETATERIVLQVVPPAEPEAAAQAAAPVAPGDPLAAALRAGLTMGLPGGALARLFVDPEDAAAARASGRGPSRVTLRYEAAAIGRVDLVLELQPGAVAGTIHAPAGDVADRLRAGAADLRAALAAATGRPASVSVRERGETVDLRA
ncbi:MAG TPA: flagellar hook-length control protein FliK [Capillimicrobium sp.]|nr:flagellar hook-length control protein FliK [Capillimicrobium sp.]